MTQKLVVLASGRGSNFEALLKASQEGRIAARILALFSDRTDAGALDIARRSGVPAECVAPEKMLEHVRSLQPTWVVLAGYMRILSKEFIEAFRGPGPFTRIINIHPSLLPVFKGKNAYQQAWDAGAQVTGCTVHLVEHAVDSGPILAQEAFSIADCKDAKEVERRGIEVEHRLYVKTLDLLMRDQFVFEGVRARVRSS